MTILYQNEILKKILLKFIQSWWGKNRSAIKKRKKNIKKKEEPTDK